MNGLGKILLRVSSARYFSTKDISKDTVTYLLLKYPFRSIFSTTLRESHTVARVGQARDPCNQVHTRLGISADVPNPSADSESELGEISDDATLAEKS